jgi:hypothetical protein
MSRRFRWARRGVSAAVALLSLALSVAVPVMERGALVAETAAESQHDPSRCAHGHDHRVCTQVSANLSLAPADTHHVPAQVIVRTASAVAAMSWPASSTLEGPPPRAPPQA